MALSNAEKQRRFKAKRKAQGLVRKESWTDRDGFPADIQNGSLGERPRITQRKFAGELNKLMEPMNEISAEEIYAKLLAHAKRLKQRYDKAEALVDRVVEEEKEAGRWP